jgi:hypothetical protein
MDSLAFEKPPFVYHAGASRHRGSHFLMPTDSISEVLERLTLRTPVKDCPACGEKRRHTAEDWAHHPDRGSGHQSH